MPISNSGTALKPQSERWKFERAFNRRLNVSLWPLTDLAPYTTEVRFSPRNGHARVRPGANPL